LLPTGFAADTSAAKSAEKPKAVPAPVQDSTQESLQRMTEELKLTAEQQKKVKKVLEAFEQKMSAARANKKLTPQEFAAKGREARAANDQQFKEILTSEQYQGWQKILAQRGGRRRQGTPPAAAPTLKTSPPQTRVVSPK
jgi:Spy/CpxP family protein refolding chaperone